VCGCCVFLVNEMQSLPTAHSRTRSPLGIRPLAFNDDTNNPPKGASIDRLSGAGASAGVLSSTLGVARCGRSAGCVLCALWAVPAAVLRGDTLWG